MPVRPGVIKLQVWPPRISKFPVLEVNPVQSLAQGVAVGHNGTFVDVVPWKSASM